jgi:membrane-bound lytic murein transglycosylase B
MNPDQRSKDEDMRRRLLKSVTILAGLLAAPGAWASSGPAPENPNALVSRPELRAFIDEMVARYDFNSVDLVNVFSGVELRSDIVAAISRPAEAKPWFEYRPIFLTEARIDGGVRFWDAQAEILQLAEAEFGVDAQVIVAIIGVETRYGSNTGSYRVIDALSTLAFDYPPRSKFFRGELEQFLLLAREEDVDLATIKGSYAGAMGYGQFIPSSYRHYAVDFDGNGKRDLWNSPMDIVGSVANYLHLHGWELGQPVAVPARVTGEKFRLLLDQGMKPQLTLERIGTYGVEPVSPVPDNKLAALIELEGREGPQYWLVFNNFYVITRYNRSPLYAMAVYQLSEEIRTAREREKSAAHWGGARRAAGTPHFSPSGGPRYARTRIGRGTGRPGEKC